MHRFFYSFTASDGSEGTTASRVVSTCSIMVHHGYRSKEARRARRQIYRLRQTTSHTSLLVADQGDVSRKLNLLVDKFNTQGDVSRKLNLLVDKFNTQGDVSRKLNQAFLLVDKFNTIFFFQ